MNDKAASQTSRLQLSDAYNDHPIVWLDPSVYNALNQHYTSIDHATRAYSKEKQDIICCYERQLQRLLSQFSIALKQIEYLEDFRKQQNKHNHYLNHYNVSKSVSPLSHSLDSSPLRSPINDRKYASPSIEMQYDSIIEQLNRKIRIMHEEMVNMKNLYIKKIDIISQQKQHEINELKHQITKYQQLPANTTRIKQNSSTSSSSSSSSVYSNDDHLRNRSIPNTPSNWKPEKQAVSMEDTRINKLYKIEEEYNTLQSEYKWSLEEIEKLKIKISNNSDEIEQIDQGKETPHDQIDHLNELKSKNVDLESKLKAAQIQHRLLLKKQKDESFLKAKKKIMNREARQLQEEEFKLQLEEVQINKDIVINRLAAEYHEMADKEEKHEKEVEKLTAKLNDMAISHKSEITLLKDEYVSRIHYHRRQIQDYLNAFLKQKEKEQQNQMNIINQKNGRRTSQVLNDDVNGDPNNDDNQHNDNNNNNNNNNDKFFNLHITSPVDNDNDNDNNNNYNNNNNNHSMSFSHSHESELSESFASHSRNDSDMSQISQSADEIVTSLVIGIDEQLDDILTPVVNNRINPYEQFSIFDVEESKLQNHQTEISEISGITEITPTKGQHTHISSMLQHQPKDTFTYLEYGISPRDPSHMVFKSGDTDFNESPPEPSITHTFTHLNNANITSSSSNATASLSGNNINNIHNNNNTLRGPLHLGPRSNASLLFANPMISMINASTISDAVEIAMKNNSHQELAEQCLEYEETMNRYEKEIEELRESLNEILRKNEEQESEIRSLKEKNRKSKRKEFDWVTKEREYKSLLAQYRELRENNAKLTLTYFTLQCEYDKLKRDYDEKSAMIMNYGDYQINLTNQIMISNDIATSSNNSSHRNLLLSNNNSNHSNADFEVVSPPMGHMIGGDLDILSDISNEDDEVDMVVGFMGSTAQRNTQIMQVNDINDITTSPPNGLSLRIDNKHKSHNASIMSNHGYNMSYFGNNLAFQYTAKTKEELIDDILKLREKLSEMTDTKFSILQSTKQEIDRLTSKVKMLEEQREQILYNKQSDLETNIHEIQLDQEMTHNKNENKKQRKSFGGGTIGMMSNDDHTYTVSKNDLDSVAKQLANKQHTRTQSMANSKYLLPGNNDRKTKIIHNNHSDNDKDEIFDENHSDDDDDDDNDNDNDDDQRGNHVKSLTVLHNVTNSDEIED